MQQYTCIIVEDEYLAIEILSSFICNFSTQINLLDTFKNPNNALEFLENKRVDLILLDINLPTMNGFDFLQKLSYKPLVIFTTAYSQYALDSFEYNVCDYLTKPIAKSRFDKAINKALEHLTLTALREENTLKKSENDTIKIKNSYNTILIKIDDIIFIESLNEYIKIHTVSQSFLSHGALKNILEELPREAFIRVHRSYIVSIKHIYQYNNAFVELTNSTKIPISKSYRDDFLKQLT